MAKEKWQAQEVINGKSCICLIKHQHREGCKFRAAATCGVGIACTDHNRDVCPICDPCTCDSDDGGIDPATVGRFFYKI